MESASAKKIRPKYLNLPAILFEIRLPVPPRAEPKARKINVEVKSALEAPTP